MEDSEAAALFPWWYAVGDDSPDPLFLRSLAWLDDAFVKNWAFTHFRSESLDELKAAVRRALVVGVPAWEGPVELETWLRGILQGCAASIFGEP